ncbi:MAG TPA: tRNA 2-selenouridine(34) synthase MnmH [Caulobacteraceae bacterium]
MIETLERFDLEALDRFDAVIDVRSPAEFAHDHIPGAVSLPVLDDAERARVGQIYVQESRLKARRIGAALVARNIALHLEGPLRDKPGSFAPLVYCWRGGQRSNALATVLSQVGWRIWVLRGGYKTYRRWITAALYDAEPTFHAILLDGDTGSAKTDVLGRLADLGLQTLDLEAMAEHRGSLFGAIPGHSQPSQKLFETRLVHALNELDLARPVVIEAESSKIGEVMAPPMLWKAMLAAPYIELSAPAEVRARYLTQAYGDIVCDPAALEATLAKLPRHLGRKSLEAWRELARAGAFEALALALIESHYDPAYRRSRRQGARRSLGTVLLKRLGALDRQRATEQVAALVRAFTG